MLVRAKGNALVPLYASLGSKQRRFVGRVYRDGAWVSTGEPVELTDHFAEYSAHVRDGDLEIVEEQGQ